MYFSVIVTCKVLELLLQGTESVCFVCSLRPWYFHYCYSLFLFFFALVFLALCMLCAAKLPAPTTPSFPSLLEGMSTGWNWKWPPVSVLSCSDDITLSSSAKLQLFTGWTPHERKGWGSPPGGGRERRRRERGWWIRSMWDWLRKNESSVGREEKEKTRWSVGEEIKGGREEGCCQKERNSWGALGVPSPSLITGVKMLQQNLRVCV